MRKIFRYIANGKEVTYFQGRPSSFVPMFRAHYFLTNITMDRSASFNKRKYLNVILIQVESRIYLIVWQCFLIWGWMPLLHVYSYSLKIYEYLGSKRIYKNLRANIFLSWRKKCRFCCVFNIGKKSYICKLIIVIVL